MPLSCSMSRSIASLINMDEKGNENGHLRRRVFLRFRTTGAPNDADIISAFYGYVGLRDADCYVHWQPRDYSHTHVIVDVHGGSECDVPELQTLPHEVYRIAWTTDSNEL